MAGPGSETQFGRSGISAGYSYTPVRTELAPPIQLPGTGELWAQVGKNALAASQQVFDTLMKSPLNPAVKAQMDLGRAAAARGMETIDWARKQGDAGYMMGGIRDGQFEMIPGAQAGPTVGAMLLRSTIKKDGTTPAATHDPENPQDSQNKEPATTTTNQGFEASEYPAAPAAPATTKPVEPSELTGPPKPPTVQVPQPSNMYASAAPPAPPAPGGFQGPNQAQTNAAIQESLARNQFASNQPGVPAGYQPPPAQPTPSDWMPDWMRQQQLQQWQAQNAHPVASAQDALAWAKTYHTGYTDATYLPHGGPGGEPAFNFTGKNGASNIVPMSQMVRNGFAPRVAAQSTSALLGVADQARQQAPPAAQPPTQYPTVAQDQTAPGQQAPPAAPGAYNPEPYRQAVAQATASPQYLTASTAPAAQPAPAEEHPVIAPVPTNLDQDQVRREVKTLSAADLAKAPSGRGEESGDPYAGVSGPFTWYQDKNSGLLYTFMPDPNKWREQRFYLGSNGWQGGYQLNSTATNETMENLFTNGNAAFPKYFSHKDIANMPMDMKKYWIEQNDYFHTSKPDVGVTDMLKNNAQAIRRVEMLKDIVNAGDKYGNEFGEEAYKEHLYAKGMEALRDNPEAQSTFLGQLKAMRGRIGLSIGGSEHPMAADVQGQIGELGNNLRAPGMEPISNREVPASGGFNLSGSTWVGSGSLSFGASPASNNPMNIPAIKFITQPGTKEERLRYLDQMEDELKRYYQNNIQTANLHQVRVPQQDIQNGADLKAGKPLQFDEKYNDYRRNGQVVNPHSTVSDLSAHWFPYATDRGAGPINPPNVTVNTPAPPGTYRDPHDPTFLRATPPPKLPSVDLSQKGELDDFIKKNKPGTEFIDQLGNVQRIR